MVIIGRHWHRWWLLSVVVTAIHHGKWSRSLANRSRAGQIVARVSSSSKMVVCGGINSIRSIWVYFYCDTVNTIKLMGQVEGSVVAWSTPSSRGVCCSVVNTAKSMGLLRHGQHRQVDGSGKLKIYGYIKGVERMAMAREVIQQSPTPIRSMVIKD